MQRFCFILYFLMRIFVRLFFFFEDWNFEVELVVEVVWVVFFDVVGNVDCFEVWFGYCVFKGEFFVYNIDFFSFFEYDVVVKEYFVEIFEFVFQVFDGVFELVELFVFRYVFFYVVWNGVDVVDFVFGEFFVQMYEFFMVGCCLLVGGVEVYFVFKVYYLEYLCVEFCYF